jgi:hypothetical protein
MISYYFKSLYPISNMDQVAHFIQLHKYTANGYYAFFQHNLIDDECYTGGLYSIANHIVRGLNFFLQDKVRDIYICDNLETPVVYFKYGMKEGNIMEVKGLCGNYFWQVKIFENVV